MARKIRFPLKMKKGAEVRTLDELKENFDLESVLGYFTDGKLKIWLADRYYDEKAEAVSALSADMPDLNAKLCEILEVEYQADEDETDLKLIAKRREKLKILSSITDNREILDNVDTIAMSQDELFDILDESPEKVYLYGEKFDIPFGKKNVCYIGVNNPIVLIDKSKYVFEYAEVGITFKNVRYDEAINPYITKGELLYLENKCEDAFPLVKAAAENGNPRAMYIIAMSYKDGTGTECNSDMCREWLRRANGLGESLSMMNYAYWCCKNDNEKKRSILSEYSESLKRLAMSGDILAQFEYGDYLCSYSDDKKRGAEFIMNAALKDFAPAQNSIGNRYYNGQGVEQDYAQAVEWYKKAAEQGHADAQKNLGWMYRNGYGIKQDYVTAVDWYRKAAEQGHADAQNTLGFIYDYGYGVMQDHTKAFEWYRKAAEQGYATAQFNLAYAYEHGEGVTKDYIQAVEWLRKAAEQGYANAQSELGYMYQSGNGVIKDYAQALEWYRKAAEQGFATAQCNLGYMYDCGYGVTQNKTTAIEWYKKSAANGNETAKNNLRNLGVSV